MSENAKSNPVNENQPSNFRNNTLKVAGPPTASNPPEPREPDIASDLYGLEALCHILFGPDAQTSLQGAEPFRGFSSTHERLFMQQQEEQERRRRFLQTSTRYSPMTSNGIESRRWLQPSEFVYAVGRQTRFHVLNRFGQSITATDEHTNDKCAICLQMYVVDEILRKLHCTHMFHQDCADQWLWKEKSCPICRSNMSHYAHSVGYVDDDDHRSNIPSTSSFMMGSLSDQPLGGSSTYYHPVAHTLSVVSNTESFETEDQLPAQELGEEAE